MAATGEITLEELRETFDFIRGCSDRKYKRTPLLSHWKDSGDCVELSRQCDLYLKLENTQITGTIQSRFFVSVRSGQLLVPLFFSDTFAVVFKIGYWHHICVCLSVCPSLCPFACNAVLHGAEGRYLHVGG